LPGIYFDPVRFDELADGYFRHQRLEGRKDAGRTEKRVKSRLWPKFSGMRALNITTPLVEGYIEERGWQGGGERHYQQGTGRTKNDKGKIVYLDGELRQLFSHQWEKGKKTGMLTQCVFPNRSGTDKIKYPY
jgi:hypothetical protein